MDKKGDHLYRGFFFSKEARDASTEEDLAISLDADA